MFTHLSRFKAVEAVCLSWDRIPTMSQKIICKSYSWTFVRWQAKLEFGLITDFDQNLTSHWLWCSPRIFTLPISDHCVFTEYKLALKPLKLEVQRCNIDSLSGVQRSVRPISVLHTHSPETIWNRRRRVSLRLHHRVRLTENNPSVCWWTVKQVHYLICTRSIAQWYSFVLH